MKFPLHGKTFREPQPIRERPNFLRLGLDFPELTIREVRVERTKQLLRQRFAGKRPVVVHWHEQPLRLIHSKVGGVCSDSCPQCSLEKRNAERGSPTMQFVLDIECDHPWRTVLTPKLHKNPRQQKKWAKLGVKVERPEREVQKWVLTPAQFQTLRDVWPKL